MLLIDSKGCPDLKTVMWSLAEGVVCMWQCGISATTIHGTQL